MVEHLILKEEQLQKAMAEYISDCRAHIQSFGPVNINNQSPYKPPHLMRVENAQVQLAMKMQKLKIFAYAYAQAGKTLDDMAIEVGKDDERDGTSTFKNGDPMVRHHVHAERQQTYQSSVEKQQKMHEDLMGMEIGFQNALVDHEQEIYRCYEKESADFEVELTRLKENSQIELRNHEENLARLEIKSLLLFILLSLSTFIISLNQLFTWIHEHIL